MITVSRSCISDFPLRSTLPHSSRLVQLLVRLMSFSSNISILTNPFTSTTQCQTSSLSPPTTVGHLFYTVAMEHPHLPASLISESLRNFCDSPCPPPGSGANSYSSKIRHLHNLFPSSPDPSKFFLLGPNVTPNDSRSARTPSIVRSNVAVSPSESAEVRRERIAKRRIEKVHFCYFE